MMENHHKECDVGGGNKKGKKEQKNQKNLFALFALFCLFCFPMKVVEGDEIEQET
jgi:hypothetical protein